MNIKLDRKVFKFRINLKKQLIRAHSSVWSERSPLILNEV